MHPLRHTDVDGVPTVWTTVPGPLRAGLSVRVGAADESYLTSGITHLLEHLALFGIGRPGDHSNGYVDQTRMVFHTEGDDQEVRGFLDALTRQLSDLPLHRLEAERGVLRAEQKGRGTSLQDRMDTWRYGAAGYGLNALDQIGVQRVDAGQLSGWSRRFATRGNSVLWLSGPPPAGLRLHLPDGVAQPPPDPRPGLLTRCPAWFTGPDDAASLDALIPRGYAGLALAHVLHGRLVDDLRSQRALAYSPNAHYRPLTADVARLAAYTDLVTERAPEAVRPFLEALKSLTGEGDPTGSKGVAEPVEVARWRTRMQRQTLDPAHGLSRLAEAAWELLHDRDPVGVEQSDAQIAAVDPESVAEVARHACGSLLAQLPPGTAPGPDGWTPVPLSVHPRLVGQRFHSRHQDERSTQTITVGASGITMGVDSEHLSIPVAATVAVLRWSDGGRTLVGRDGNRLPVEPTLWRGGADLVRQLDRLWPSELFVDQGSRPPSSIPQPGPAPARRRWWHRNRPNRPG